MGHVVWDACDTATPAILSLLTRFARFCTLPMQDVRVTIAELERGMVQLGLKRGT